MLGPVDCNLVMLLLVDYHFHRACHLDLDEYRPCLVSYVWQMSAIVRSVGELDKSCFIKATGSKAYRYS